MDKDQLKIELERAATSLLNDDEIVASLGISEKVLFDNYSIVEKTRLKLKQSLNAKRISQAANTGDAQTLLAEIPRNNNHKRASYTNKAPSRGGKREGAGRPKGTGHKVTIQEILDNIEKQTGQPFAELLAQGYYEAIQNSDKHTRIKYEQMLINKVVADKMDVAVSESADAVEAKKAAFAEALAKLTNITTKDK